MELEKEYYASPRWTWEILDCAMPMTFDTYSNCAHQCVYCFAFFQRAISQAADDYLHHRVKSVSIEKVKRMFLEPDKYAGSFAWYIKQRMVLQWGGLSDGFDWYERKFRKSLELLRFFREIDYPISISTKGVWFLDDPDYIECFRDAKNVQMKYSIITDNIEHAQKLEAGTPEPQKRFEALKKLKDLGVAVTTVRFRPFVIGVSDKCIDSIFKQTKEANCDSITVEFLCLESRASNTARERFNVISQVCGFDVLEFYKKHSAIKTGLLRLNYDIKRPYFEEMQESAQKYNLPLFVSDAHHKEKSVGTGCCGLPDNGPLSQMNRGQFAEALQIAKQKKRVYWSDIAHLAEPLKNISFGLAEGYNQGTSYERAKRMYQTMYDFMHSVWNDPKSAMSPARYFGGALVPTSQDEHGDIVYLYNQPFIEKGQHIASVAQLNVLLFKEEVQKDGAAFGHVAFPVFIVSKGRHDIATTMHLFDEAKLNYTIVVEPKEKELYQQAFPYAELFVLSENDRGIAFARQQLLEYCRQQKYEFYWQIDDNLHGFKMNHNGKQISATARAALSWIEQNVMNYENVALAGPEYQQFAFRENSEFAINKRIYACVLTKTTTGLDYQINGTDCSPKEDVLFSIKTLNNEWCTLLSYKFSMEKQTMSQNKKGGCVEMYYQKGIHERSAKKINEMYPHITKLVKKSHGLDVQVNWASFKNNLKLVKIEALNMPKESLK